jgi:peptidoglycan/xylan/chitin deacetylase (PgdA/CDA1 family)
MAILAFHSIENRSSFGINNYKPSLFKELSEHLKTTHYGICTLDEYLNADDVSHKLCFTFDDGYKSFIEVVFPILNEFSIPASVFIPAGMVGRKNSWEYSSFLCPREHLSAHDIRYLADLGVEIGSHGHSHIALTTLSDRFLRMELEKSKRILEDIAGRSVDYISYPFGRVNMRVEAMAMQAGYNRGFSLARLPGGQYRFTLRRSAIYGWDTPYSVSIKAGGESLRAVEQFKEKVINFYSGGTILLNRLRGKNLPITD